MECSITSSGGSSVVIKEEPDDENDLNTAPPSGRVCVLNNLIGEVVGSEVTELSTSENPITTWQECDAKTDEFWESKDDIEIIDCHGYNNETVALVEAERLESMEVQENNDGEVFRPRRSLRKKVERQLRCLLQDVNEESANVWSDDSDDDPDFSVEDQVAAKNKELVSYTRKRLIKYKRKKRDIGFMFGSLNRYGKLTACFYCNRRYLKIERHLQTVHKNEAEVIKLMSLPLKSEERQIVIKEIKAKGNSHYNEETDKRETKEGRKNSKPRSVNSKRVYRIVSEKKRIYKKNFCVYCQQTFCKMSQHFQINHGDKPEVKQFVSLEKGSKERLQAIQKIINKGNFDHNKQVISRNNGDIIPYRTNLSCNIKDFLPCNYCLGFYSKRTIYRHLKTCYQKEYSKNTGENDIGISGINHVTPKEIMKQLTQGESKVREGKTPGKKSACFYCRKLVVGLRTHLQRRHADEPEVKYMFTLKLGSKERYVAIQALRRKGNYLHNKSVLSNNTGTLITSRNIGSKHGYGDFLPCEHCFGFYKAKSLIRHSHNCILQKNARKQQSKKYYSLKENRDCIGMSRTLLTDPESADCLNQVLSALKNCFSKVMAIAKDDDLILKFGAIISIGKKSANHYKRTVLFKMRYLGRLLARINSFDNRILKLSDSLRPENFQTVIKAVLSLCSVKDSEKPVVTEKFYKGAILHCCMISKNENLMNDNKTKLKEIDEFLNLIHKHWPGSLLDCMPNCDLSDKRELGLTETIAEQGIPVSKTPTSIFINELGKIDFSLPETEDCFPHPSSNKIGICIFCSEARVKLTKHYVSCHPEEPEVKHLTGLQLRSEERLLFLMVLRNKGNYFHNIKVIKENKGFLVVRRGIKSDLVKCNYSDYSSCDYCLGYFRNKGKHTKRCHLNPLIPGRAKYFSVLALASVIVHTDNEGLELLEKIIPTMKSASLKETLMKDDLIKKYASIVAKKNTRKIATRKVMTLGLLLLELKKHNSTINNLHDCLQAKYFDDVIDTVEQKALSGAYNSFVNNYNRLRLSIWTCCRIVRNECFVNYDEKAYQGIMDFMLLLHKSQKNTREVISGKPKKTNLKYQVIPKNHARRKVIKWDKKELVTICNIFSSQIRSKTLPGKYEIEKCIEENECLQKRNWVSIKSKIRSFILKSDLKCITNISKDNELTKTDSNKNERNILNTEQCELTNVDTMTREGRNDTMNILLYTDTVSKEKMIMDLHDSTNKEIAIQSSADGFKKSLVNVFDKTTTYNKLGQTDYNCLPFDNHLSEKHFNNELNNLNYTPEKNKKIIKEYKTSRKNRREWTEEENTAVIEYFCNNIKRRKVPSKAECDDCIEENSCLQQRGWVTIKSKVYNIINSTKTSINHEKRRSKRTQANNQDENKDCANSKYSKRLNVVKTPWTEQQNKIIDEFFKKHIESNIVPGKRDCEECIRIHECLRTRNWVTVKSKVHNIITTKKRQSLQ